MLAVVLVAATAAEFLLLRVLNRAADRVRDLAGAFVVGGTLAMNLALLTAFVLLLAVAAYLWVKDRIVSVLLVAQALSAIVALVSGGVLATALASGLLAAAVLVVLGARAVRGCTPSPGTRWRWALGPAPLLLLVLGAFLAGLYLHLGDAAGTVGLGPPGRVEVFALGEALAVGAALAAAVAFRAKPDAWNVGVPTAVVLVALAPTLLRPDLAPLIAFWSLGFQMSLPLPLYFAALWALVFAIVNAARHGVSPAAAYGLVLVALAGRMLNDLYSVEIAVAGVLFLSLDADLALVPLRLGARIVGLLSRRRDPREVSPGT